MQLHPDYIQQTKYRILKQQALKAPPSDPLVQGVAMGEIWAELMEEGLRDGKTLDAIWEDAYRRSGISLLTSQEVKVAWQWVCVFWVHGVKMRGRIFIQVVR